MRRDVRWLSTYERKTGNSEVLNRTHLSSLSYILVNGRPSWWFSKPKIGLLVKNCWFCQLDTSRIQIFLEHVMQSLFQPVSPYTKQNKTQYHHVNSNEQLFVTRVHYSVNSMACFVVRNQYISAILDRNRHSWTWRSCFCYQIQWTTYVCLK